MRKFLFFFVICLLLAAAAAGIAQSYPAEESKVLLKRIVFFELSKSGLTPESERVLEELAVLLKLYPQNLLVIEGHADATGEERYNKNLSNARAKSVYDFFIENGIDKNRMKIVHYGDKRPFEDNSIEEGRIKNRRAEIIVFKAD